MELKPQSLINTGMAWRLEGSVGRYCMSLIRDGQAVLGRSGRTDFWGNYVPSRTEVKAGTPGSVRYANNLRRERGLPALTGAQFDRGLGVLEDGWD